MVNTINVSSKSSTKTLSELLLENVQTEKSVVLKAIGAGAVNQAVKAIAIAELNSNTPLKTNFTFFNVIINGQEKSGIGFEIKEEVL